MKHRVIDTLRARTHEGDTELTRGQVITLPHITAENLLREGKITKTVYSQVLKTYLWIADDAGHARSLRSRGIIEPIYTFDELRRLGTADEAAIRVAHEAKRILGDGVIVEVESHKDDKGKVADSEEELHCADGPPQCGVRYSMKLYPQTGELAAWCRKRKDWCWVVAR